MQAEPEETLGQLSLFEPAGCAQPRVVRRPRVMGLEERILYHQAHPLKLVIDAGAGLGAVILFWAHAWGPAVVLGMGPPALASVLVIGFADLQSVAQTRLGGYVRRGMTLPVQLLRLGGYLLTGYGAWYHNVGALAGGLLLIVLGWLSGAARRRRKDRAAPLAARSGTEAPSCPC